MTEQIIEFLMSKRKKRGPKKPKVKDKEGNVLADDGATIKYTKEAWAAKEQRRKERKKKRKREEKEKEKEEALNPTTWHGKLWKWLSENSSIFFYIFIIVVLILVFYFLMQDPYWREIFLATITFTLGVTILIMFLLWMAGWCLYLRPEKKMWPATLNKIKLL